MTAIGKHLRVTRIGADIENTIIADVLHLSESIRVIGIYWPHGQVRDLKELGPCLVKGTIITGDFNAAT